eukprot:CAMPEP_0181131360 /NCGR_PEP_ID=MMETSP1071-20121207/30382_1 /TAXON_ID=35127 /ORGANISM="Thalassiosira sp., Strain NH16" /LENGTH=389 /DNA_ID=CAMNT_0023217545 /DNA_START=150 /DNA_END=1319 /DNA_ORIENTATION=+
MSRYQHSFIASMKQYTSAERTIMLSEEQRRGKSQDTVPLYMCNRKTPFQYDVNPLVPSADQKPLNRFVNDWEKTDRILLLRNDGKFGHIGNQINSLLHAFDYARDNKLHLGMLFHSWSMDVINTMFYETDSFDDLGYDLLNDLGIVVIRNQTQLEGYTEVVTQNAQQLYFYRSSNLGLDTWRETMRIHIEILQRLYLRYNRGYGYVHNGLRAQDLCATLDSFFHKKVADVKYTVIHSRYIDGNAEWRLEKIAKTTGLTVEGGVMSMGPAYIKSILKPLGMLDYPIILITDGQLRSVERGLLNDDALGPKLMVLSNKVALEGADVALALLADVFIGNPASVTSGFIARSRTALGYSEKSTQLFRRKRIHQWYSVCNEECVFNPWILGQWV